MTAGALSMESDRSAARIAVSAAARENGLHTLAEFHEWFAGCAERSRTAVEPISLDELTGWSTDPATGNIVHDSGRFFAVEGVAVHVPDAAVPRWNQPIINQPEIGILGALAAEFDGVLHLLMQAKVEPGNHNGLQLSPTVQATRSNYTRAHRGRAVPYLDYFRDSGRHRVLADVRQSEQGSWFHRKRNRNMIVEVREPVPVLDGFCWLTLGQIQALLAVDDLVNMDSRTVLSCLPFTGSGLRSVPPVHADDFHASLVRSCASRKGALHDLGHILSWITEVRSSREVHVRPIALDRVAHWRRRDGRISHDSGLFFDVMAVRVRASGREVNDWTQPMIAAEVPGVVAFLVRRIGGVLHALVQARAEPGYVDVVELAPTVQCKPDNYRHLPAAARPAFLDEVLTAASSRIRFAATLSEEGGRFYRTRNRYLIVEADRNFTGEHPDFRWMTVQQLAELLRHSHYLNVQARSLVACLHSLC